MEAGELFELEATLHGSAELVVRGVPMTYDADKSEVSCLDRHARLAAVDGKVTLHVLVDRASIDIFGNEGRLYMPMGKLLDPNDHSLTMATKGDSKTMDVRLYRLKSSWRQ